MALAVGAGHMALAQEATQPETPSVENDPNSVGAECASLRMPGIAEGSDEYGVYVQERCQPGPTGTVEASIVIGMAGERYREFIKGHQ